MDKILWEKIQEYDLDKPYSQYGFSTRLEKDNYWTKDFTQKAILEYKKFMYLAGTSELMVSPSEIIDIVWHQHLTFTKSYEDFCRVIGKKIHHIPSTHNRDEADRFKQAKEHTNNLYKETFGRQPEEIWKYASMYESLELPKAKYKLRTFIIIGLLVFAALILPFYFFLSPVYPLIEGPEFMLCYIIISIAVFISLLLFDRFYFTKLMRGFKEFSFIKHLQPSEVLYLETKILKSPFMEK